MSTVLKEALGTLRELELYLKFFNMGFEDVLWRLKVYCLTGTILGGFSAILLIHTNPVLGGLYAYSGLAPIIVFIGTFQFSYKVTEKLEDLKNWMEIVSTGLISEEERKYWARVLRSIPRMGMSLGGFNKVEREAVPIFIDFCIKQIVSLLLAFQ